MKVDKMFIDRLSTIPKEQLKGMTFIINDSIYVLTIVGYTDNRLINKDTLEPLFNLFNLSNFNRWLPLPVNYRKLELELQRAKADYLGKAPDLEETALTLLVDKMIG